MNHSFCAHRAQRKGEVFRYVPTRHKVWAQLGGEYREFIMLSQVTDEVKLVLT